MDSKSSTPNGHAVDRSFYLALDYFFHVVEHGSVTLAATTLGVKAQTISSSIRGSLTTTKRLRELYTNSSSPSTTLQLTAQGEIFYKYARELVDLKNRLHQEVTKYDHYKNSRLFTIAATPFYNISFITDLISRLRLTSPNSKVKTIIVSESDSIENINTNDGLLSTLLIENKIDLFLGSSYPFPGHYSRKDIGTESWKLIFHAIDAPKLYSDPPRELFNDLPINGISGDVLLTNFDFAFCEYIKLKSYLETKCPQVNVIAQLPDYSSLIDSLKKTGVFSIVPESVAMYAYESTSGELVYTDLPSSISPPNYVLCGYFSTYNAHSDAGQYLHDELRNLAEDYYSDIDL